MDSGLTTSLFQEVFRNFLNHLSDAFSEKFSYLPFTSVDKLPNAKIDDKTALFFVGKYWRSWRSYINSLGFLTDFRNALSRLSTSDLAQVFDALLSLLPIESETFRKRRNVAEANRIFSSFDELVGGMQHFKIHETAKFDMLCSVVNCLVADMLSACLLAAHGARQPPSSTSASSSSNSNSVLSETCARVVISHCLLRLGRPAERTGHEEWSASYKQDGGLGSGSGSGSGSGAASDSSSSAGSDKLMTGPSSSHDAASSSSAAASSSSSSSQKPAATAAANPAQAKLQTRIDRWHQELPEEEWRYWRAKGWQQWSRLLGLLALNHFPIIIDQLQDTVELYRKEKGTLIRSIVYPISCMWFMRICAPIHYFRDFDLVGLDQPFQRFNSLVSYLGRLVIDTPKGKDALQLSMLCALERVLRQSAHLNLPRLVVMSSASHAEKDALDASALFRDVLTPLYTKLNETSKQADLKVISLRVMTLIALHSPREFFNKEFPTFFAKRVLAHLDEAKKSKHSLEIVLSILRGTFAEFELSEPTLRVLRQAAIKNKVDWIQGRHPWAATVRRDDSAEEVQQRLMSLMQQLPIKKISKFEAFQWRVSGRNLLRNVILQIAAQNIRLAFEVLFNTLMQTEKNAISDVDSCALGLNALCVLLDGSSDFQRFMIATPIHRTEMSSFDASPEACVRVAHEAAGMASAHNLPLSPKAADLSAFPLYRNPQAMWVQKIAGSRLLQLVDIVLYLDSKIGSGRLGQSSSPLWPASIFSRSSSLFAVRTAAQQAVLDSTTAAPVLPSTWWRLDSDEPLFELDEAEETQLMLEQKLQAAAESANSSATVTEGAEISGAASNTNAENSTGNAIIEDFVDDDGYLDERAWKVPRDVLAKMGAPNTFHPAASSAPSSSSTMATFSPPESLETEANHVYVAQRLCESTAYVRAHQLGSDGATASFTNAKGNTRSVYFAPFFDRQADFVAQQVYVRQLAIEEAQQAVNRAANRLATHPEDSSLVQQHEEATEALTKLQSAPLVRSVADLAGVNRNKRQMDLGASIEATNLSEAKQALFPLFHDALRCVAFCPNSPAVLSMAIDINHPVYLGRLLFHIDHEVASLASQALQQIVRSSPRLMGAVSSAIISLLQTLSPSDLSSIRTLLRQLGALLEAWTHAAAFDIGANSSVLDRELGDREERDARLLELESLSLLYLCHPNGDVRSDAWQLSEAVRLADLLLYDIAYKAYLVSTAPVPSVAALFQSNSSASPFNAIASTHSAQGAYFGSMSGSALFSSAPLSPLSARSFGGSQDGGNNDDAVSVASGVSIHSNLALAAAAAGDSAGAMAHASAAAALVNIQPAQQSQLPPPQPPASRLSTLLLESSAHLMQAAHAAEMSHAAHFDLAGSAFDSSQLERFSCIDWIQGRTGLFWATCASEIAHTLNAVDRWQPLRRRIDPLVAEYLQKLLASGTLGRGDATVDSTVCHVAAFYLALRPERDPDVLGMAAAASIDIRAASGASPSAHPALLVADEQSAAAQGSNAEPSSEFSQVYFTAEQLESSEAPELVRERDIYRMLFNRDLFSVDRRDLLPALLLALECAHYDRLSLLMPAIQAWFTDANDNKHAPKTFFGGMGELSAEIRVFLQQTLNNFMLALSEPVRLRMLLHMRPDPTIIKAFCAYLVDLNTTKLLTWTPNPRRFRNVARMIRNVASALTVLRSRTKWDDYSNKQAQKNGFSDDVKSGTVSASTAPPAVSSDSKHRSPLDQCSDSIWSTSERMSILSMLRSWSDAQNSNFPELRDHMIQFITLEHKFQYQQALPNLPTKADDSAQTATFTSSIATAVLDASKMVNSESFFPDLENSASVVGLDGSVKQNNTAIDATINSSDQDAAATNACFFDTHDQHFNSFTGSIYDLQAPHSNSEIHKATNATELAAAVAHEASRVTIAELRELERACFEAGAALCTLGPVFRERQDTSASDKSSLSEEKKAEEKNSDSKSPDADSSSSTRKRADSVVPQEFNFDLNDWLRWALRAEHQRVPMLKALMMYHINTLLPSMLDCIYSSYVVFSDSPLVSGAATSSSDAADADSSPKSNWPVLFSQIKSLADRRHAADLFLHVILAQLVRGNAPSPVAMMDGFAIPAAIGGRCSALALSRLAAARLPIIISPSMLESLHPLLPTLMMLSLAHLNHPSGQISSASWLMLNLLTPFYVPAELRPNFSMQSLLGRFRAALLDTDLVMRRHQACEISAALASFCHPSIIRKVIREFILRWTQLCAPFADGWLPNRPAVLLEHQMSALRVVECIVPWFNALPLDKLAPSSINSTSSSSSNNTSSASEYSPVDTQLLLPLITLSRHHLCAFGVAAHYGLENLWRALMRCPSVSILPAAASWQAKQVALASSPQLLERQRECIRAVIHFMLRLPMMSAFASFLNPVTPAFEFESLAAYVAAETNAALNAAGISELRADAKKHRAAVAAATSDRARKEATEASVKSEQILTVATAAALKDLKQRKLADPKSYQELVPTDGELADLFRHLVKYEDESLISVCRLLVRALFQSNAETVLHTLFLFLSDVNGSIIPLDSIVFSREEVDAEQAEADAGNSPWLRTDVSRGMHIPLPLRHYIMRSMATRLVHDVVLLQFSHQAASLHLLMSHAVISLKTPNAHAQPLLGFLLSYLAPRQGSPAIAAHCTKLAERAQHCSLDFAWHAHILPLAAMSASRGAVAQHVLHEMVDSLQRQRRGVERLSIEHIVLIAAEWAKAKFDHVLDMWGAEALRIAVASACTVSESPEAADSADTRQASHALRLYGCLLQPARSTEVLQLGTVLKRMLANGLRLWSPVRAPGELTVSISTDGPKLKVSREQARNSLHLMCLLLEVLHHMALTFYSDTEIAALAPPSPDASTGIAGYQSSASMAATADAAHSVFATSVSAPIGSRMSSARSASVQSVFTPLQTEEAVAESSLAATALFSTMSPLFADAFSRTYTTADGRMMTASRAWNTDAFLMYCQLFWIALGMLRSNTAPITPLALRLLRAVMCHSTFATFLRSFPPHMSVAFNTLFGANGANMPQFSSSSTTSNHFSSLLKAWSSIPAQGQSKLERQHQRFLLCGAQWHNQISGAVASTSSSSEEEKHDNSDESALQPKPKGIGFLGLQQAAMSGMLHVESFDDALTLLIECWQISNDLLVDPHPTRHLINLVAVLPWLCHRLSLTFAATPVTSSRLDDIAAASLSAASSWSGDWGAWCLALASAIRSSPLPEAVRYHPIAACLDQCSVIASQAGRFTPAQRFQPLRDLVQHLVNLHFPTDATAVSDTLTRALVAGPVHLQVPTLRVAFLFLQFGASSANPRPSSRIGPKFERLLRIAASLVSDPTLNAVAEELIGISVQGESGFKAALTELQVLEEEPNVEEVGSEDRHAHPEILLAYEGLPAAFLCLDDILSRLPILFGSSNSASSRSSSHQQPVSASSASQSSIQASQVRPNTAPSVPQVPTVSVSATSTQPPTPSSFMSPVAAQTSSFAMPALVRNQSIDAPQQQYQQPQPHSHIMASPGANIAQTDAPSSPEPPGSNQQPIEQQQPQDAAPVNVPLNFESIVDDPVLLSALQVYVEQNFDTDGLDFYLAALDFEREKNAAKALVKARSIVKQYIELDSADTINMEESVRAEIVQAFEAHSNSASGMVPASLFSRAMSEVQHELDLYVIPSFLESPEYQQVLKK